MILRGDKPHTVASLTAKTSKLIDMGLEDTGFPVLVKEENLPGFGQPPSAHSLASPRQSLRVIGFLGINELSHALCERDTLRRASTDSVAVLADEPDAPLTLVPDESRSRSSTASMLSYAESSAGYKNPYDLTRYLDQVGDRSTQPALTSGAHHSAATFIS